MKGNNHHQRDHLQHVARQEERRHQPAPASKSMPWLGLFGIIGWSVTLPLLAGVAAGLWIDRRFPTPYSFTLMLMFFGLVMGCLNAWYWVKKMLKGKE